MLLLDIFSFAIECDIVDNFVLLDIDIIFTLTWRRVITESSSRLRGVQTGIEGVSFLSIVKVVTGLLFLVHWRNLTYYEVCD